MALRILGTPADAADVVQETFLRAYVRIPVLRGQTIRAWLFRVAINCSHDVQRRTVRRPADPLEDCAATSSLPDPALSPEASALARERVPAVREALLTLHPDFRAVVVLRDVNGLSYEEMSTALRIPIGTVKSRLNAPARCWPKRCGEPLRSGIRGGARVRPPPRRPLFRRL